MVIFRMPIEDRALNPGVRAELLGTVLTALVPPSPAGAFRHAPCWPPWANSTTTPPSNLQAVPPTGSISYINNSTSSIHPIASKIEIRKEGKIEEVELLM